MRFISLLILVTISVNLYALAPKALNYNRIAILAEIYKQKNTFKPIHIYMPQPVYRDCSTNDLKIGVKKLSIKQKENCRLYVVNGLIYTANGELFDTDNEFYLFIMNQIGDIYAMREEDNLTKHTTLSLNAPISAAGEIVAKDGVITYINDMSGHYVPPLHIFMQIFQELLFKQYKFEKMRVETENCCFDILKNDYKTVYIETDPEGYKLLNQHGWAKLNRSA